MKQIKRNKRKVWLKTYGRPFAARKAMVVWSMGRDAVTAIAEINVIMHASADKFQKGLAIAGKLIANAVNMANKSKVLSKGFANEQSNKKD